MGVICSYKLWILGEDAKHVVDQVLEDGWILVSQSEMGAEFESKGNYLLRDAPRFREYSGLLIVMSADHDLDMGWHHLLHAEEHGHQVSRYWEPEPEVNEEIPAENRNLYDSITGGTGTSPHDQIDEEFMRNMREMEMDENGIPDSAASQTQAR